MHVSDADPNIFCKFDMKFGELCENVHFTGKFIQDSQNCFSLFILMDFVVKGSQVKISKL